MAYVRKHSLHGKHVGEFQLPSVQCAMLHPWSALEMVHHAVSLTVPPAVQLVPVTVVPLGSTRALKAQPDHTAALSEFVCSAVHLRFHVRVASHTWFKHTCSSSSSSTDQLSSSAKTGSCVRVKVELIVGVPEATTRQIGP